MLKRFAPLFRLQYDYSANPAEHYRARGMFALAWVNLVVFLGWIERIAIPGLLNGADGQEIAFGLVAGLALIAFIFYAIQTGKLKAAARTLLLNVSLVVAVLVLTQFNSGQVSLALPVVVVLPVVVAGILLSRRDLMVVMAGILVLIAVRAGIQSELPVDNVLIPAEATEWDAVYLVAAAAVTFLFLYLFNGYAERVVAASQHDLSILRGVSTFLPAVADSQSERSLMTLSLNFIRERLNYSTAQLFLLDEEGALVQRVQPGLGAQEAGAGLLVTEVDREMIETVVRTNQPLIVTLRHENNGHLIPPARSAVAVPVRAGKMMLGVLDIHSERASFSEDEVAALAELAAQLGVALVQRREFDNLQQVIRDQAQARAVDRGRQRTVSLTSPDRAVGFDLYPGDNGPIVTPMAGLPPYLAAALEQSEPFVETRGSEQLVHVPIRFRGETLGAMSFTLPRNRELSERQMTLIRTVSDRLAQALENTRLFEQTQAQAFRERKATEVANTLIGATDVRAVLERAAETFNEALGAVSTRITLQPGLGQNPAPRARGELS